MFVAWSEFYTVQTNYMWQGDRMKSYTMDKFKDTLDIRLFTMKTPKLSLKQKIIISIYL